ncbi:MAG: PH domain-containing protein [Sciscionella sp.]
MDNIEPGHADAVARWAPPLRVLVVSWLVFLAFGLAAAFWDEQRGQLLFGVGCVAFGVFATHITVARPRLEADDSGVRVRSLAGSTQWPWAQVQVRLREHHRWGRRTQLLELEGPDDHGADGFCILGRLDLGTDPDTVAKALFLLRPQASS